ncbi:hypothetical protein QVD17_13505 [Tagetes erecta]|uniref:DUF7722 domain-containing protein n=1 Tax=Tagetes erecta TaxID=13708 RepID=A0AAD8L058_TARER|nr:hypothetical protein QVD17_13505 [Tagetes erecta]
MGQIVCIISATMLKLNPRHQETTKNEAKTKNACGFQMPLHYPRYKKDDYEKMPEWKIDCLLKEYGLPADVGDVNQKRKFAMGAFLWT